MSEKMVKVNADAVSADVTQDADATNAIVRSSSKQTRLAAFTPVNLTEALALAKLMSNSEVVPKEFKGKPANILVAMQMGAEVGLAPMQALQSIAVINGRPSLWGDAMLGLVQSHPEYEWHKEYFEGEGEDFTAVFVIKRKGHEASTTRFSVRDARVAKLWGKRGYNGQDTPWITNPKRMLQLRSRGFGLRDRFADALKGLKLAEESLDIAPESSRSVGEVPVQVGLESISESSEPNRGHGNEGTVIVRSPSQLPPTTAAADQTPKKQEDWICAECQQKNCHTKDCSHCAAWLASLKKGSGASTEAKPTETPTQATEASQKSFQRVACVLQSVNKRTKKPLRTITVVSNDGEWSMSVWHQHLYPILDAVTDKANCIFEYSTKVKDGREWTSLEHILEVNGQKYADDKPVEVVEGELTGEQIGFPKETVDDVEIPE